MARTVMRACRNPACTKGEFPTKTARAAYCSSACRLIHHRQQKKQQIQTEGKQIMSNTPLQFAFSESEYKARCENAEGFYLGAIEKQGSNVQGAIVELQASTLIESLELYHAYRAKGYSPLEPMSHLPTASLVESPLATFVTLYLTKPVEAQAEDLEGIYAKVRADYESELECKLQTEAERQVQMVLAKQDRDAQLAAEQNRLKREQAIRDELAASREKLRSQLIGSGKLNADGSAE